MVMKRPLLTFLTQPLLSFLLRFVQRARLEDENFILRQELMMALRRFQRRARLQDVAGLLLVWSYRLYPSLRCGNHRSAEDHDPFAPMGFPHLLAREVPSCRRPCTDCFRDSDPDTTHEPREPAIERTTDPWRIVDARDRSC